MKSILVVLLFVTAMFASNDDFLTPSEAFKVSIDKKESAYEINVKLDKTIYLYDEFLSVVILPQKIDITKELKFPTPVNYDDFIVHFNGMKIEVPHSLIKEKVGEEPYELQFNYQGCSKKGLCYSPMSLSTKSDNFENTKIITPNKTKLLDLENIVKSETIVKPENETDTITQTLKDGSLLLVLATFFGFGLLLSFTPCIFPMIPILSSIIVQQSNKDGGKMSVSKGLFLSVVYVLAMSVAYTVAGVLAGLFGANLQAMLQDPIVIMIFAGIFVLLAFSMFGYFEIGLPQSWQTKLNKTSDESSKSGGVAGVAVMGFFSALIVGPCVAPPLAGALVYIGQTGDAFLGGAALFVMSLGMGLPLLAIGVGAGKYMPKPGGWMETVTKVFGIVMLAIALWMLERIIPSIVFMFLSSFLLLGAAIYLKVFENIIVKLITTVIFIYGVIIFTGAVSGSTNVLDPLENFKGGATAVKKEKLDWLYVTNLRELDDVVKKSSKPIMVDFWATWCVSCKELDNITFKDAAVKEELSKYQLVKVDVTKNTQDDKALMKKFNLFGPPALIFYKDGKEELNKRIIGYKNPQEFMENINK
ncbi:protein-disulfide reductase DsbD [Arcobacteraceae bacterium]|nr:protein-disulfide reductase DsbD [Arcobacteraceae bacterium]